MFSYSLKDLLLMVIFGKYKCKCALFPWCKCCLYSLEYVLLVENVFFNRRINQEDGASRFHWILCSLKFQYKSSSPHKYNWGNNLWLFTANALFYWSASEMSCCSLLLKVQMSTTKSGTLLENIFSGCLTIWAHKKLLFSDNYVSSYNESYNIICIEYLKQDSTCQFLQHGELWQYTCFFF